ncbi:Jag family protein [Jatrophihabitans sp. YIM 134969]
MIDTPTDQPDTALDAADVTAPADSSAPDDAVVSDDATVVEADADPAAESDADADADDESEDGEEGEEGEEGDDRDALLVQEGDIAADYLEQLLDIVDFDGDIDLDVENDRAVVSIEGEDLGALVGPRGETLDALQELTRLAVAQKTGTRSRLMLDVGGHRARRRQQLQELASSTAEKVTADGESVRLAPMNPFERKVVHDAIAAIDGVHSESEGEEPSRRVVVLPDAS